MFPKDPKYASGTRLERTDKEEFIERIEGMLDEMSDELFISLKKLNIKHLRELDKLVSDRITELRG